MNKQMKMFTTKEEAERVAKLYFDKTGYDPTVMEFGDGGGENPECWFLARGLTEEDLAEALGGEEETS